MHNTIDNTSDHLDHTFELENWPDLKTIEEIDKTHEREITADEIDNLYNLQAEELSKIGPNNIGGLVIYNAAQIMEKHLPAQLNKQNIQCQIYPIEAKSGWSIQENGHGIRKTKITRLGNLANLVKLNLYHENKHPWDVIVSKGGTLFETHRVCVKTNYLIRKYLAQPNPSLYQLYQCAGDILSQVQLDPFESRSFIRKNYSKKQIQNYQKSKFEQLINSSSSEIPANNPLPENFSQISISERVQEIFAPISLIDPDGQENEKKAIWHELIEFVQKKIPLPAKSSFGFNIIGSNFHQHYQTEFPAIYDQLIWREGVYYISTHFSLHPDGFYVGHGLDNGKDNNRNNIGREWPSIVNTNPDCFKNKPAE